MKLLILGATGGTGQLLIARALEQGHEVTAFVRNKAMLTTAGERVRVLVGDTTEDAVAVADAVQHQDAVISTLGRRNSFRSANLMSRSMRVLVPAMENTKVCRLILVSAFGVGDTHRTAPLLPRIMYSLLLGDIFTDEHVAEDYVRRSTLDWTFIYPTLLTNGQRTGHYRTGERLTLHGIPKISRADVADFILRQLGDTSYLRKAAIISY